MKLDLSDPCPQTPRLESCSGTAISPMVEPLHPFMGNFFYVEKLDLKPEAADLPANYPCNCLFQQKRLNLS
jgi:hypothetical protein